MGRDAQPEYAELYDAGGDSTAGVTEEPRDVESLGEWIAGETKLVEGNLDSKEWFAMSIVYFCDTTYEDHHPERKVHHSEVTRARWKMLAAFLLFFIITLLQLAVTGFLLLSAERMETEMENGFFLENYHMTIEEATHKLELAAMQGKKLTSKRIDKFCDGDVTRSFLCGCAVQLQVDLPGLYSIVLFVWVSFMISQMRQSERLWRHMSGVARVKSDEPMLDRRYNVKDGHLSKNTIVGIGFYSYWIIVVSTVFLPMIVYAILMYAGAKFLLLQTDQSKLVMKVLCMRFVIQVDDFLTKSFSSWTMRQEATVTLVKTKYSGVRRHLLWNNGFSMIYFMTVVCVIVQLIFMVAFRQLTFFRSACRVYRDAHPECGMPKPHTLISIASELFD